MNARPWWVTPLFNAIMAPIVVAVAVGIGSLWVIVSVSMFAGAVLLNSCLAWHLRREMVRLGMDLP